MDPCVPLTERGETISVSHDTKGQRFFCRWGERYRAGDLASRREVPGRKRKSLIDALPFHNERIESTCVLDVVEHAALPEVGRLLRLLGQALLSVPLHPGRWTRFNGIVGHSTRFEPTALARTLAEARLRLNASAAFEILPQRAVVSSRSASEYLSATVGPPCGSRTASCYRSRGGQHLSPSGKLDSAAWKPGPTACYFSA